MAEMTEIKGKYNTAKVYTDDVDESAVSQIKLLCDQEFCAGSKIRIMPDVHAGAGCTIGFTMDITDKVCPNLVGVDIGFGMLTIELGKADIDYQRLDDVIRKYVPFGRNVHEGKVRDFGEMEELKCFRGLKDTKRLVRSVGTLGGGNHFIEVDIGSKGDKQLIIHSGSRNLGLQVAQVYQRLAIELCSGREDVFKKQDEIIRTFKEQGRRDKIQGEIKKLKAAYEKLRPPIPEDLCYLTGNYKDDYLHDMAVCQRYASANRSAMADIIIEKMGLSDSGRFETVHNYINFGDNILRKGAISANEGEMLLIPVNMKDGCILGKGKGNADWNFSAPHGAGRLMSRNRAKEILKLGEFRESMRGVFTTSVGPDTLDEAPMAYKSIDDITGNIADTVDIIEIIKSAYNFKASE